MIWQVFLNPVNLIVFLILVTLLVAAHEYGHYLFARWFRMEVEEFALGFGRPKWIFRRANYRIPDDSGEGDSHETVFTLRPVPLGGFVRIRGMSPEADGSETKIPNGFYSKSPGARWLVLFAGPLFSVLAGFLVLIPLYMTAGVSRFDTRPILEDVGTGGPAYAAGLRKGDRIVALDGHPIEKFFDIVRYVRERPEKPIRVEYEREGSRRQATLTPVRDSEPSIVLNSDFEPTEERRIQGKAQIGPGRTKVRLDANAAFKYAFQLPGRMVSNLFGIVKNPRRFDDEMGGPMTMIAATAGAMESGPDRVIELAGLLSISLGVLNLLPCPPFDGGQMMIAFFEMLRRGRRLSYRVQELAFGTGTVLVLLLFVGVLFADVKRFLLPSGKKPAVKKNDAASSPNPNAPAERPK